MNQIELQSQVLNLLENFNGIAPMKKLFWTLLNYDQVNKPTSRRGWPDATSSVLQEDPFVLASGGENNDFHVVYCRLAKDRLLLADERIVTTRLLKDHPYGLFVFSDRTQTHWHFLNVQMADEEAKRKLFRRVTVGPNEKMRTACQVISQLDLASIQADLFGLSPLVIQQRHDQAFDVEPVTEEFFREYHSTFEKVEGLIRGIRDQDRKRLFTQRLFNRLMFIAFIQKKGWLQFGGKKNHDYLDALWTDYKKNGNKEMGFYYERLYNLFFHGLGAQDDVGIININRGGFLRDVIGNVPYLNGGLFEEDDDDKDGGIKVPDEALKAVLHDLFDRFNFTVTEATPLDVEVAVDPEMLGKVFEELVTGRHETGSYYTPKPIVSFMCREALKGYLEANLPKENPQAIAKFVDEHEPGGLRDAESVLEVLRRVRCCDPACGSGAYLLGMLHELMDLRSCLFKTKQVDSVSSYDRKLEIIQRSLYGVDLDPFAVNIARLRLWLSLAVEFEGQKPEPLPNLKFEIEEGDSLAAPGPEPTQALMWAAEIDRFGERKAQYIKSHGDTKKSLELEIVALKQSIASWTHHGQQVGGFDWAVEFAEVFREGGFDIVVANPPYVRQELIMDQKPQLRGIFPDVYHGVADLYVYFYRRAIQILKAKGMLVFISSNKWFRSNYGAPLRTVVERTCRVVSITDFGDLPVFKSASAYPLIFVAQVKVPAQATVLVAEVKSLDEPYPDILTLTKRFGNHVPFQGQNGQGWSLAKADASEVFAKMVGRGIPLGEFIGDAIRYGIKTGLNEAFVIDSATRDRLIAEDRSSAVLIKPLIDGRDIRKWQIQRRDRWLIFTRRGTDLKDFPAIKKHLLKWKTELEPRPRDWPSGEKWPGRKPGSYRWYEIQDDIAYYERFDRPKIYYPDIAKGLRFAFDKDGLWGSNTTYFISTDDLYVLAVLNSLPVEELYLRMTQQIRGGYLRFFSQYVQKIPIPEARASERKTLVDLAKRCLRARGEECGDAESEINGIVAGLFGLELSDFTNLK